MNICKVCDGTGWIEDDTACGDPDHCSSTITCPECGGTGERKTPR